MSPPRWSSGRSRHSFAGRAVGTGLHAFTWCLAVAACEILGGRVQHFLIVGAVKLANPKMRMFDGGIQPRRAAGALRRDRSRRADHAGRGAQPGAGRHRAADRSARPAVPYSPILVAQSRIDSKTGLLNVSTWESEAEVELSRAIRTRQPGGARPGRHRPLQAGQRHLRAPGRRPGAEGDRRGAHRPVPRLRPRGPVRRRGVRAAARPDHREDACKIAERLRGYVAAWRSRPTTARTRPRSGSPSRSASPRMARGETYELTDLLAAADSAMYAAKQAGRNRVAFAPPLRDMGIDAPGAPTPDADSARRGYSARASEPQPAGTPRATLRCPATAWCWSRRSRPPLLYAFEGNSPCLLGHCLSPKCNAIFTSHPQCANARAVGAERWLGIGAPK